MKARYEVSLKTLLAGLGIALLSACSGSPTGPSAPAQVERSSITTPAARSNFSGYVVAERDSSGGAGLTSMGMQVMRRVPPTNSVPGALQ